MEAARIGHNAMTFARFMDEYHGVSIDTPHYVFLLEFDLYPSREQLDVLLARFIRLEKIYRY